MKARATRMIEEMRAGADALVGKVDGACDLATKEVEQDWANRKLEIVPGSAMLDEVYKSFGIRYDKMRDGVAIAAQMEAKDIEKEIEQFIRQL